MDQQVVVIADPACWLRTGRIPGRYGATGACIMKKIIIFGGFAALLCLAAAARAEDTSPSNLRDGEKTTVMKSDRPDGLHGRDAHEDRSREHEAREREHEARSDHDPHEASEHRRRR
jgi:hypothetical protein